MHAPYESLEAWIGANVIIRRICLEVKPNIALLDGPFRSTRRSGNHVFDLFLQVAVVTRTCVSLPQGLGKSWVIGKRLAFALAFDGGVQLSLFSKDRRDQIGR